MAKLDDQVLTAFEEVIFTRDRLNDLLKQGRQWFAKRGDEAQRQLADLQRSLNQAQKRLDRLYDAIELGELDLDETLHRRIQQAKATREAALVEISGLRRQQATVRADSAERC